MSRHFWLVLIACLSVMGAFAYTRYPVAPGDSTTESVPSPWNGEGQGEVSVEESERFASPLIVPKGDKLATFAGGCFWGVEERMRILPGVIATRAGYTGGSNDFPRPTYRTVHADKRGFVEAVELVYDPARVRYETLLANFCEGHTQTKGATKPGSLSVPRPYRWHIFTHDSEQRAAAERYLAEQNIGRTAIRPAQTFWTAEQHHQQYYANRGASGATCSL